MARPSARGSIREEIDRRKFRKKINQALWRVLDGEPHYFAAFAEGVDPGQLLRAWRSSWHGEAIPLEWERFLTGLCETATAEAATPTKRSARRGRA